MDKKEEEEYFKGALRRCGYPSWALKKVMENKKRKTVDKRKKDKNYRSQIAIPYVTTAMRPHTTLRRLLVHPKDKVEPEKQGELVYQIQCRSCGATYIGDTGRLFKTRLIEHKKDVENAQKEQYTRSEKKRLQSTTNKSAPAATQPPKNHLIDWEGVKVVDRRRRIVKEAIWMRKTKTVINRDEGNYELPHVCDDVIQCHWN